MNIQKKIKLSLVRLDGNAFNLLGQFSKKARKEGWTKAEIDFVIGEATKSDYNHLFVTLAQYCETFEGEEKWEED